MLDPKCKCFHCVLSFIGYEQNGVNIVKEYDSRFLYLILLTSHRHLHAIIRSKGGNVNQIVNENCNLYIFEQTANTSEPMKKLVNRKLLIFKQYQVNFKDIKCPFQ